MITSILQQIKSVLGRRKVFCEVKNCKMAIVVRTDIPMSKGKIGSQCAHAAIECYRKGTYISSNQSIIKFWLLSGQPKIILKIQSEKELLSLEKKAQTAGLITATIKDAGRTQLKPGTISALGIGPAPVNIIDEVTSSLRLL